MFVLTIIAGVLMVSNMRFKSFKDFDLKGKVPFVAILIVVLIFVFISIDPPIIFFSLALIYALSGPVVTVLYLRKRRAGRAATGTADNPPGDDQS